MRRTSVVQIGDPADLSLRNPTMRLKRSKNCSRFGTFSLRIFLPRRLLPVCACIGGKELSVRRLIPKSRTDSQRIYSYTRVRRQEIDNDYAKHSLISFLLFVTIPATCWAKGETKKIEISGDRLNATIEIFDPSVVTKISIWNGPMVRSCDSQGNCTAQPDPEKTHAFVDWPKGMVDDPSSNLER